MQHRSGPETTTCHCWHVHHQVSFAFNNIVSRCDKDLSTLMEDSKLTHYSVIGKSQCWTIRRDDLVHKTCHTPNVLVFNILRIARPWKDVDVLLITYFITLRFLVHCFHLFKMKNLVGGTRNYTSVANSRC